MGGRLAGLVVAATRFFQWWRGELAALIPPTVRNLTNPGGRLPLVDLDHDGDVASVTKGGRLVSGAAARLAPGTPCRVRLPAALVVGKTIALPEAAAASLSEVLRFQVEQETPFRGADVCFDQAVVRRDRKAGCVIVDWRLVPRQLVEDAIRRVESLGLRVRSVGIAADEPGLAQFDFHRPTQNTSRRGRRLRAAFAAALALLVMAAVAMPLVRKVEAVAERRALLATARASGEAAGRLRDEVEALRATAGFVIERRLERPTASELLRALTDLLPDDSWLYRLTLEADALSIAGFSPSSSALVARLDAHPWFQEVAYRSPILQRSGSKLEEFDLTLRLAPMQLAQAKGAQ